MTSYADQVAADIAARYGVAVAPGAVQVVAQGASGIPLPVWDGRKLITPDWKEKRQRMAVNRAREARRAGAASDEATVQLRDQVQALYLLGMTDSEIAAELGQSIWKVEQQRRFLKLPVIRRFAPQPEKPLDIRRRRVGELIDLGRSRDEICTLLGVSKGAVTKDAAAIGKALPKPPRVRDRYNLSTRTTVQGVAAADRQAEVLRRLDLGQTRKQICADMGLSSSSYGLVLTRAGRKSVRVKEVKAVCPSVDVARQRRARLAKLVAQGADRAQIRAEMGGPAHRLRRDLDALGVVLAAPIKANPKPRVRKRRGSPVKDAARLRRAQIADLVAKGADRAAILKDMGITAVTLAEDLRGLGLKLPKLAAPVPQAARWDRLRALAAQGAGRDVMAGEFGCSYEVLSGWIGQLGLSVPRLSGKQRAVSDRNRVTAARRAQVAEMRNGGATLRAIAQALGQSRSLISHDLVELRLQGRLQVVGRVTGAKKRRASDPDYAARILAMAASGATVAQIASLLAFSPGAVAKVLDGRPDLAVAA